MVSPVSVSLAKRPNVLVVSGEGFGTIARGFDSRQLHKNIKALIHKYMNKAISSNLG